MVGASGCLQEMNISSEDEELKRKPLLYQSRVPHCPIERSMSVADRNGCCGWPVCDHNRKLDFSAIGECFVVFFSLSQRINAAHTIIIHEQHSKDME